MNRLQAKTDFARIQYPALKPLELSDHDNITWHAERYNRFSCEYGFASLYLWNDIYQYKLSFYNDWLLILDTRDDCILMPLGENITPLNLVRLTTALRQNGYSGNLSNVPPEFIQKHPELEHYFEIETSRGLAEYIYSTEKLATLSGKKLRKKKNHISQFSRKYPDYQVRPLDAATRKDCLVLLETLLANSKITSNSIRQETIAINKGFEDFDQIPLEGIAIYTDKGEKGQLTGFAVYSRLNAEVYTIHFEKVDYRYPGAAQVINRETAIALKDKCNYINREQDLGIPGLRQAKLSYDPELIYPACYLTCKDAT